MRATSWLVLISSVLLLLATSCGGSLCVGYGCTYWDPCYPWCPYSGYGGLARDLPWLPRAAAAGDFDADGVMDLLILDDQAGLIHLPGADPAEKVGEVTPLALDELGGSRRVLSGHFDADGVLDLVVMGDASGTLDVFRGTGDGRFEPRSPASTPAWLHELQDVDCARRGEDEDELSDLCVLSADGLLTVYRCDGAGGFLAVGLPVAAFGDVAGAHVVTAELDGRPGADAAVVLPGSQQVVLLSGRGDGTFEEPLTLDAQIPAPLLDVTWCTGIGDAPADLVLLFDAEVADENRVARLLLHGADAGLLQEPALGVKRARRVTTADLTGDDIPDLILVDPVAGTVEVLRTAP